MEVIDIMWRCGWQCIVATNDEYDNHGDCNYQVAPSGSPDPSLVSEVAAMLGHVTIMHKVTIFHYAQGK